jgi:SAM-dependent methyltransferase
MDLTEHATRNRAQWNEWAADYVAPAERHWRPDYEPTWGVWELSERDVRAFGDGGIERFAGKDAIELGCGAGYVSAWLARAGARVTGVDVSDSQLTTARRLQSEHGLDQIGFLQASAEDVPLPDASFDLAISEYGACLWCDPFLWVPEAARLLRPGGELIFLTNSPLSVMCLDEPGLTTTTTLHRPLFGMHAQEWPDDNSTEFHLPHGAWIDLLGANGLQVERLIELQAPEGASTRYEYTSAEWARQWPSEEVWVARRVPDNADSSAD